MSQPVSLTEYEQKYLQKWWKTCRDLDEGTLSPADEKQRHFVQVCRGKSVANTRGETAWVKARVLMNQTQLSLIQLKAMKFRVEPLKNKRTIPAIQLNPREEQKETDSGERPHPREKLRAIDADRWGHRKQWKHRPNW